MVINNPNQFHQIISQDTLKLLCSEGTNLIWKLRGCYVTLEAGKPVFREKRIEQMHEEGKGEERLLERKGEEELERKADRYQCILIKESSFQTNN